MYVKVENHISIRIEFQLKGDSLILWKIQRKYYNSQTKEIKLWVPTTCVLTFNQFGVRLNYFNKSI